jgi:hypothetical protein
MEAVMTDGKLWHWIRTAIDKWTDMAALFGGLLGIVLIAVVVMTGLHERQLPLRSGGISGSQQTQP